MNYYIEDSIFPKKHPLLMRFSENDFSERYDYSLKKWVIDKTLSRIYTGEIECIPITEKEAKEAITQYA